jgi:cell wall-associated NlpC family hydrolase
VINRSPVSGTVLRSTSPVSLRARRTSRGVAALALAASVVAWPVAAGAQTTPSTVVTAAVLAPSAPAPAVTVLSVAAAPTPAKPVFTDGIADTARVALDAFPAARSGSGVTPVAASAPSSASAVPQTLTVSTETAQNPVAVQQSLTVQGAGRSAAVSPASPAVTPPTPLSVNGGSAGETWTGTVIETSDLNAFVFGTLVETVTAPTTAKAIAALPVEPTARYSGALRQLADLVSARTKVDANKLYNVWLATDSRRMTAILTAMAQVGTQYRFTGNKPGGFDCSGLTSYAWAQAGVKLPRVSGEQISWAAPKSFEQLLPGDLIWRPGHIGLYLGVGDAMVHSPQTGKTVEVRKIGKSQRYGGVLER